MKTGIPFSLPYYSYECPSPICEIESYWWDHKKSADTNIWHRTLFYLVPPTVTVCTIIFWWLYHSFFCVNFLHHWTELLFSQKVFAFLAISSNVARLVRQEPNKEGKKVAGAAMIGGDPPAPSNQLTSSLSSSPLAPSFTLFHFSLINLHRILTPGLSSSSVIDSNGRREERKKFRREFRFRAARSNLRYSMSNLQSSSKLPF